MLVVEDEGAAWGPDGGLGGCRTSAHQEAESVTVLLSSALDCFRNHQDPQKLNLTAVLAVKDYMLPLQILPQFPNRTFVCALAIDPQDIGPFVQAA